MKSGRLFTQKAREFINSYKKTFQHGMFLVNGANTVPEVEAYFT